MLNHLNPNTVKTNVTDVSAKIRQHVVEPANRQLVYELFVIDSITAMLSAQGVNNVAMDTPFDTVWREHYLEPAMALIDLISTCSVVSVRDVTQSVKENLMLLYKMRHQMDVSAVRCLMGPTGTPLLERYRGIVDFNNIYLQVVKDSGCQNLYLGEV